MSTPDPKRCCDCQAPLKPIRSPHNDGTFLGCSNHEATGCRVSWSLSQKAWHGSKLTLARASKLRGQAKDAMAVAKQLAVTSNVPLNDAIAFVQKHGVQEALKVLAA